MTRRRSIDRRAGGVSPLMRRKSQIRSTKSETNSKDQIQNRETTLGLVIRASEFEFVSDFVLRASCFRTVRRSGIGRQAFSLLEIVLSLAILTAGLTACLGLIDLGVRSAREARDQTRAQEICESVLGL